MSPEQEAFNKIYDWFVFQGKPAGVNPGTQNCRLRTTDGKCCGVGLLIPDEEYKPSMEKLVSRLPSLQSESPSLRQYDRLFLYRVRFAHDRAVATGTWSIKWHLNELAKGFNLTVPTQQATV